MSKSLCIHRLFVVLRSVSLVVTVALLTACSLFGDNREDKEPRVVLAAQLEKAVYRPGEMVTCRVVVSNHSFFSIIISPPYSGVRPGDSNLHFRVLRVGGTTVLRKAPVQLAAGPKTASVRVKPFESLTESCAFVDLTERPGKYRIMLEYQALPVPDIHPRPEKPEDFPPITQVLEYEVTGDVLFHRDPNGLLLEEDAIQVAAKHYGKDYVQARAKLVETPTELYDWWVTLERRAEDVGIGQSRYVAYFVSPYGGFVREDAPPLKIDPDAYFSRKKIEEAKRPSPATR